ncbi:MAG TPA: CpsD/CapB family tyrosine-protein kinase [Candidatus Sumerlaeota bacterium]|nr:MAG: Tyrosine-protein kinase YwqD [candidate division BRC1 bacterium ADurb.BinA292]HOE96453.1 CpsD/CapB family tyrosine-protein kinase [Candidatus Sumerlaeota bacterium]HOR28566.1 CpsD/CapB family tyrosine-protein kinase [Candidatus Sumerlaeota bacterium]HPK02282.1 CpsD/CapB family tyrosine-protein kinase [Candidatus Sumerlaeota bacterium]
MAKVLDALEQARRERLRKLRAAGARVEAPLNPTEPGDDLELELVEAPQRESALRPGQRPVVAPAAHPHIAPEIVALHASDSPVAEQVRQIRTNLETVLAKLTARTIVITSPVSGDGKTLVAANLATILADDPRTRVMLVDADLRKPDQHRLFGVKGSPGLAEYLRGRHELADVAVGTSIPNLDFIPAGFPPDKPTVLLSGERMGELLKTLEETYQWVLFDTPPMLPVTDASLLARHVTGLILVVRVGSTTRGAIERTQEMLAETHLPILGCILNDFNDHAAPGGYYHKAYGRAEAVAADEQG